MHYHLGAADAAAGRNETARWHLAAAVGMGDTIEAARQYIDPEKAKAIEQAREALKRLQ